MVVVGVTCAAPVPAAAARCVKVGITPLPPPSPPQPRHSTDTRISPPSDCSTLILSVILRNLCSSAPNYTGSLNWTVRKEGGEVVEPHPGRPSVLLGRTFALPSRHSVTSTIPSSNHLSPASQKRQAPPSCISTSEKYIFKAGGACANLKTMSTNPKRNSDSVANEGGDGVVLYANQRATCSWLWPSPTPSNPTPKPHQRFHVLLLYPAA